MVIAFDSKLGNLRFESCQGMGSNTPRLYSLYLQRVVCWFESQWVIATPATSTNITFTTFIIGTNTQYYYCHHHYFHHQYRGYNYRCIIANATRNIIATDNITPTSNSVTTTNNNITYISNIVSTNTNNITYISNIVNGTNNNNIISTNTKVTTKILLLSSTLNRKAFIKL